MPANPQTIERARLLLLPQLARAYDAAPTAANATVLGRCAWQCGEYDTALQAFADAHRHAPADPAATLALARAASSLDRSDLEFLALDAGGTDTAPLALHRALHKVRSDPKRALALIDGHVDDPACVEFADALRAITAGRGLDVERCGDDGSRTRAASFNWVHAHATDPTVHAGLPIEVLRRGLDAMPDSGLVLECGVYFGRSLRVIASRVDGDVHGFDSFEGLPDAWSPAEPAGTYGTAGRKPVVGARVHLHAGWFERTLPAFLERHDGPVRFLHVDCDLYSSTRTVLDAVGPRLLPGSVIVFDDMLGYPGYEAHELRAWSEWSTAHGVRWTLIAAALLGREVAIRIGP